MKKEKKVDDNNVPKEEEKIAVRRAARVKDKVETTKRRLYLKPEWWSEKPIKAFSLGMIWFLNLYLVFPFFGTEAYVTSYSGPVIPD